ncbi:uncharacterized protein C8Q71DRAFT_722453 [Rhodofomes roseus]|uniref:Uncharacterized protein n=1 Tax=Rhodofomes roseus TaxID=34475 RepID=A0ABQ8KPA4_9APHY|nr:uncharacterized protein C8Q71DRAFT_722453 [Rhodofomes roseus]KAH9839572.1 hypothetical protein C8Q71DRAFT_722453 [Rhodofomes roseus]
MHGAVNTPKKLHTATQSFKAMMGKIEPEEVFDSGDDYVPRPKQKPYMIVFVIRQPAKRGPPKHLQRPRPVLLKSAASLMMKQGRPEGFEGTDDYQDNNDGDIVELSDEEDEQQEIADMATIVSSDDEPLVSTKGHASTSRLRRCHSILEMSRSSPDWDNELVGSTRDSPIKRANLMGPPDTPATPSPSKDKVRAKWIVALSDQVLLQMKKSPRKHHQPRSHVQQCKHKAKAAVLSDAEDNPFIAGTSNKEAVFIGGKQKDRDDAAGVPGAVHQLLYWAGISGTLALDKPYSLNVHDIHLDPSSMP